MEENKVSSAAKYLGQTGSYAIQTDKYDPSLLQPIPRTENRDPLGIKGSEFIGYDVWHCHEATFLLKGGAPIAGTLKVIYPSSSESIVESKSFKLYLNSFDMCRLESKLPDDGIEEYEGLVKKHLSELLGCMVEVSFFNTSFRDCSVAPFSVSGEYLDLVECVSMGGIEITDYKRSENHIRFTKVDGVRGFDEYKLSTNVLRSRCHITSQKDTGNALIHIITKKGFSLDVASLFTHIVSFRDVNEFHENGAEKLYLDIMETGAVESCSVVLLYARRGSLDINPIRASSFNMLPTEYLNIDRISAKEQNQ